LCSQFPGCDSLELRIITFVLSACITVGYICYAMNSYFVVDPGFIFLSGTDFILKKHSNQRGGLMDTVFRVRSASLVKMVYIGHSRERPRVSTNFGKFCKEC
jgi:hypothetical protein